VSTCSGAALRLRAPAKLNLGLRLMGVRSAGYHLLESIFAPIDLCDELELAIVPGATQVELQVAAAPDARLPEALASVPAGPENLVFRAAERFCRARGVQGRVQIRLEKRIPAGAGLGGGSSDAASVLTGLAALVADDGQPDLEGLEELALELGADVPFFLAPGPALVTGIGERIEPLEGLPGLELVLANPGISLATAEVYRAADALGSALTPPGAGSTMRAFSRLSRRDATLEEALGELLVNDLEPAARRLCPPVARLADALREAGALAVAMTGSGATVFGVFASGDEAARVADDLRARAGSASGGGSAAGWVEATRLVEPGAVDPVSRT
jgi:4-diphosphocytidyl-2-C-methyl-D-erythritol kinase